MALIVMERHFCTWSRLTHDLLTFQARCISSVTGSNQLGLRSVTRFHPLQPLRIFQVHHRSAANRIAVCSANQILPFSTSRAVCLRKPPSGGMKIFGVPMSYIPWPSQLLKAIIRRRFKQDAFGDEAYKKSMFHRLSFVYAMLAWTGLGFVAYISFSDTSIDRKEDQDEENKVGADWYYNTIKSPAAILDTKKIKVVKISGLSVTETVDITEDIKKEATKRYMEAMDSDDPGVRRSLGLPLSRENSLSAEEFRQLLKERGDEYPKDWKVYLDDIDKEGTNRNNDHRSDKVKSFVRSVLDYFGLSEDTSQKD